ncbi:MAG: 4-alpha-glucanotransferase [Actinobacteria bacterium]|nr:4-alpha-glucanotransferase [Actinomycetota bacterium]
MTENYHVFDKRASGILLHISSLPSACGIGDCGPGAYRFIDFLKKSGQGYWQILPLNPTTLQKGNSPYACPSAFACNPVFISPESLIEDGLLKKEEAEGLFPGLCKKTENETCIKKVNYKYAYHVKKILLKKAYDNFFSNRNNKLKKDFENYCQQNNALWLEQYASFKIFKEFFFSKSALKSWSKWPEEIKFRSRDELSCLKKSLAKEILHQKLSQYIFERQWLKLKDYANNNNIKIIGDVPMYVDFESSDVWANAQIFKLDKKLEPLFVSGVPPDYFSKSGQLWNNPVYDWQELEKSGFEWWIKRISRNMQLFDILRMDHFRGFSAYWEVPSGSRTAKDGRWINSPGEKFFKVLMKKMSNPPIIAENLGVITPDVEELIKKFNFPGISVLQFAFGNDYPHGSHLPHNYIKNFVVYTGTHDNNTIMGWFIKDAKLKEKRNLSDYLGKDIDKSNICAELINLAESSAADLAVIAAQDILELDHNARMNHPSTAKNNWRWQLTDKQMNALENQHANRMLKMAEKYLRI